jgi:DegV family protein with EDD domain
MTAVASGQPSGRRQMIRIVTDSSCDLPAELVAQHRIEVVPLTIRFGDEEFADREQLSGDEFWHRLTTSPVPTQTAAPSAGRFLEAFRNLTSSGADGIVVACISGKLSATHQSAMLATEQFTSGVPVRVVDTNLVSAGLGLVAIEASEAAAGGASLDEVADTARVASANCRILAALDTLEYLRRGGRIGGAAAMVGSLLDVKPLIAVEDGVVTAAGRVRTRKRALATVLQAVVQNRSQIRRLAVVHSDPPDLDEFLASLRQVYEDEFFVARLGPIVGSHTGPGVVGVCYRLR